MTAAATATKKLPAKAKKAIARIALEHCGFETLEERHSDRLDFLEVAVWRMKAALEAAYLAGAAQAVKISGNGEIRGTRPQ